MRERRSGISGLYANPVGYWKFNGNANNEIIDAPNGVVTGATLTTDKNGYVDCAYNFTGSNQYITIGDYYDIGLGSFSCSVWFNANNVSSLAGIVSKSILAAGIGRWAICISKGSVVVLTDFTGGGLTISSVITTGQWYNCVMTLNRGGLMKLYVNGNFINSINIAAYSAVDLNRTTNLRFGSYNDASGNPGNYFNGKIDNVRIYNEELTAADVAIIYNNYL